MDISPLFLPGREPTVHVHTAVTGGRFVKLRLAVNAVDDQPQVTPITVEGEKPYAVAERDKAAGAKVKVYRNGRIPVEAGAVLAHGERVMAAADGTAIPYVAGAGIEPVGWCCADTADGALAPIDLELGA